MSDTTPPVVQGLLPLDGSTTVEVDDPISFDIVDDPLGPGGSLDIDFADLFETLDISDQIDGAHGATAPFVAPAFLPGSLEVYLDGDRMPATEVDPDAGTFTLDADVPDGEGLWLQVDYIVNHVVTAARFSSIVVRLNGSIIFSDGEFAEDYDGVLTPILGGYTILIDEHPDFPEGALQVVKVDGEDLAGNPMEQFEWSFSVGPAAVVAAPAEVQDDGGYLLLITGSFATDEPCTVVVMVGEQEFICYSGTSGQGYAPFPLTPTQLRAVTPVLPVGGPYDLVVRQGGSSSTIEDALTVYVRNWEARTFAVRRVFPPWFKTGPRTLDTVGLLP